MSDYTVSTSCEPKGILTKLDGHSDLISFLSAVQSRAVDLLPLTWRQAGEPLGRGGTAIISQSLVNLDTSFAFKRTVNRRNSVAVGIPGEPDGSHARSKYEREAPIYKAIISELSILRHPAVRDHPHILSLQAICWGIYEESHEIWPVLIFPKSDLGDLQHFMNPDGGAHVTTTERLKLCTDVAEAISVLHENDIIHGDIKPQNVLLFKDERGGLVPKLADFGYSTMTVPNMLIYLPKSEPWTAPEHHHRGFTILSARRMDVYSLGLLCFWLLFKERFSNTTPFWKTQGSALNNLTASSESREFRFGERGDSLSNWVGKVIDTSGLFDREKQKNLKTFFNSTLARKPEERLLDWMYLIRLLYDIAGTARMVLPISEAKFECPVLSFQIAVCYSIGFGVARNDDSAAFWLEKSLLSRSELEHEIEALRVEPRIAIEDEKMWELYDKGHLTGFNITHIYQTSGDLDAAEEVYKREISDIGGVLGCNHILVQNLELDLGHLLWQKGDFRGAETLQEGLKEKMVDKYGLESPRTWTIFIVLSSTYGMQGKWHEAGVLLETIVEIAKRLIGPKHLDTKAMMSYLASAYLGQGKWKEAEAMSLQINKDITQVFGYDHPFAFDTKMTLASAYKRQGRWSEAEIAYREVVDGRQQEVGLEHPQTLLAKNGLAMTWNEQGRFKEAEELQTKVVKAFESLLSLRHPWTMTSMSDLAVILTAQGLYDQAKELLVKAVDTSLEVSGLESPDTLKFMNNLASTMQSAGQWQDLEETQLQIVEISKKILGDDCPEHLLYSMNLAKTYNKLGRHDKAEILGRHALETVERVLGPEHPTTVKSLLGLAGTYRSQEHWKDAEMLECRAVEVSKKLLGNEHPTTLLAMDNLADTYINRGLCEEAETLLKDILSVKQSLLGATHLSTLKTLKNLGRAYSLQKRLSEAEELYVVVSDVAIATVGLEHPFTLISLSNLVSTYDLQGRGDETTELMREVLGIDIELSG